MVSCAVAQQVSIIPSILVKRVLNERGPHDVADLPLVEAWPQFLNHLRVHDVALFDVDAVDPGKAEVTAATCQSTEQAACHRPL